MHELIAFVQAQFAGGLLYILALALAKLSVCAGFNALSPETGHRRMTLMFVILVIVWAVVAFFGTAFECGSHGTWETGDNISCIDRVRTS